MATSLAKYFGEALISLKYRNMKYYCLAAAVSLIGSLMQETMIAWVAYDITHSAAVLGNIMSWFMLPMIAANIPAGFATSAIFSGSQAALQAEVDDRMCGGFYCHVL
jgi:hypothetical protein